MLIRISSHSFDWLDLCPHEWTQSLFPNHAPEVRGPLWRKDIPITWEISRAWSSCPGQKPDKLFTMQHNPSVVTWMEMGRQMMTWLYQGGLYIDASLKLMLDWKVVRKWKMRWEREVRSRANFKWLELKTMMEYGVDAGWSYRIGYLCFRRILWNKCWESLLLMYMIVVGLKCDAAEEKKYSRKE